MFGVMLATMGGVNIGMALVWMRISGLDWCEIFAIAMGFTLVAVALCAQAS